MSNTTLVLEKVHFSSLPNLAACFLPIFGISISCIGHPVANLVSTVHFIINSRLFILKFFIAHINIAYSKSLSNGIQSHGTCACQINKNLL